MACSKCRLDNKIVNKHFDLCIECNNIRLHGNPYGKVCNNTSNKRKLNRIAENKTKVKVKSLFSPIKVGTDSLSKKDKISLDESFYRKCFDSSDHKCEECGDQLPDVFEIEGKVIAKWRYSHVVPKSIAPEIRYNINNINHLCLRHHQEWENGDKKSMNIYSKNKIRLPKYF